MQVGGLVWRVEPARSEAKNGARSEATSKRCASEARRRSVSIMELAVASLQPSFPPAALPSSPSFAPPSPSNSFRFEFGPPESSSKDGFDNLVSDVEVRW